MKCDISQEFILQGKLDLVQNHLTSCAECRRFLKTYKGLATLPSHREKCPDHLSFEKLTLKTYAKKTNIIPFKYIISMAAAVLLVIYLVPFQHFMIKDKAFKPPVILISQRISSKIANAEQDLAEFEEELLYQEGILYSELQDMQEEINFLI
ncbi:hypothetical protein ACFLQ1_01195 [Candidatus Auribacterota bacterium]